MQNSINADGKALMDLSERLSIDFDTEDIFRSQTRLFLDYQEFGRINSLDAAQTAFALQQADLKVVPIQPRSSKEYHIEQIQFVKRFPCGDLDDLFRGQNIAVSLGRRSQNLFIVRCKGMNAFNDMCKRLPSHIKWVTRQGETYCIWLLSIDGEVPNTKMPTYDLLGSGNFIIPPSIDRNGELTVWLLRNEQKPATLGQEKLRKIFPMMKLQRQWMVQAPGLPPKIRSSKIRRLINWANAYSWLGRTGIIDKKVFIACCQRADLEDIKSFRATAREIAELAQIDKKTAAASLKRLQDGSLISLVSEKEKHRLSGFRYSITLRNLKTQKTTQQISDQAIGLEAFQNHDAFSRNGLGASAAIVYQASLQDAQVDIKSLVQKTGRAPATVKSALNKLKDVGLVRLEDDRWHARSYDPNRLDEIAEELGTGGALKRKKECHSMERERLASNICLREMNRRSN